MELVKFTSKNCYKLPLYRYPISLHFFLLLSLNFSLLDPDPHIECGSRTRRENDSGSGSTALVPGTGIGSKYNLLAPRMDRRVRRR